MTQLERRDGAHIDILGGLFVLNICDLAVVDDHGPPSIALSTWRGLPCVLLGEEGLGVGEEQDIIALGAVDLAPGVHDPGVVARNGGDDVYALVLELAALLEVGGKVVGLAAGREGACWGQWSACNESSGGCG